MTKHDPKAGILNTFVLDSEALSQAVKGNRLMLGLLELAADGEAEVVTSPMTLIEAYDGRITERRWDWVLSRVEVVPLCKEQARAARRLLANAGLHGHKYAIDAALAALVREQKGQVTVLTSDVGDLKRLVPPVVAIQEV
ncbi:hypothetical protein DPM19_22000 [Actinomadura craniellae]|uniref:PIN domain-containing protein n=1 Tax=Actinomadura craniellae TaxID=2231787 RepID=A0A365H235_9ACTN|nr:PIN domain-containing protein [Actinomadura craniellae]RAY13165.1 hypothetical protein DPM19_22000 [Actinomadura craniellae]